MMPDEKELVERLYYLYFKKLFIYANAALRDSELAKDVVQDTFHEAVRRIDVFATHENPGGWLMNVVKNKIKEYERNRRRDLFRVLSLEADFPDEVICQKSLFQRNQRRKVNRLEIIERYLHRKSYGFSNGWYLTEPAINR